MGGREKEEEGVEEWEGVIERGEGLTVRSSLVSLGVLC